MNVFWTLRAIDDFEAIQDFVRTRGLEKAKGVALELAGQVEALTRFPGRGRPERKPNTRELVFTDLPYIVVYRGVANRVEVLRVLHTSRRWP